MGKGSAVVKSSSSNPTLKDMVIEAIAAQKEKSGSSLDAIKKYLSSKYQMDAIKQAGRLNRLLPNPQRKWLRRLRRLVAAQRRLQPRKLLCLPRNQHPRSRQRRLPSRKLLGA